MKTAAIAIGVVVSALAIDPPSERDMSKFLRPDGTLADRIVYQEVQAGAPGRVGIEIAVEPDGSWTKTRVYGPKKRTPMDQGKLSPDELERVAQTLAAEQVSLLPKEFGKTDATSNPNPRYLTFKFGADSTELLLPPRTDLETFKTQVDPKELKFILRFESVAQRIKELAGGVAVQERVSRAPEPTAQKP